MRYGIFSDIHSNIEAFTAVCELYSQERIDRYIFLGDIVGYGASPKESITLLKDLNPVCVCGNHDRATINKFDVRFFNHPARAAIVWTKKQISRDDIRYLNTFSLTYEEPHFICVHASLNNPEKFNYVWGITEASLNFPLFSQQICFMGHSHKMGGYILKNNTISYLYEHTITLEADARYIFNAGSVGQPRDRDPRASLCIYDSDENLITFKRVEYTIKQAADKILENGLPEIFASRLYVGW